MLCPQAHIPAPSERVSDQPQYALLKTVSAEEASAWATRAGDSNQPSFFPSNDFNWRFGGNLLPETISYLAKMNQDFSLTALAELVGAGDRMVEICGSLEGAARQVQEYNFRGMAVVRGNIARYRHIFPAIATQIEITTVGETPEYTGPETPLTRDAGLPYDRSKSLGIVEKFRKMIRTGKMIVTSNRFADVNAAAQPCSTSVVHKRLPDRTLSADFRAISDLRRVNLGFDVEQFYPVVTPMVVQIVQRIMKLKMVYPSLPLMICKRDIDSAFHKVFVRPDLRKLLCHELDVSDL